MPKSLFTHFITENHIATGPFDGKITYTTTKDINKIIITGISTTEDGTTIPITEGTVKIKTGTVNGGECAYRPKDPTTKTIANATKAKITTDEDGKTATLEIDIKITPDDTDKAVFNDLAALATPHSCSVSVDNGKKTLTIKSAPATKDNKCTVIEIKITDPDDALKNLGLQPGNTTTATVRVDPPPNHLTITYTTATGTVKKKGAVAPPNGIKAQSMTEITNAIFEGIKNTAEPPPKDAPPNSENYYSVTDSNKIRYSFKLKNQLDATDPIKEAAATIIVDYEHIFAEGFGSLKDINPSMISPLLIVLVGMGLAYGFYRDTKKDVTTYHKGTEGEGTGPPEVESKDLKPENLTASDIESITVTGTDGKSTTYNKAGPETTPGPGTPSLTIKKDGEVGEGTNATFNKEEGTTTVKGT